MAMPLAHRNKRMGTPARGALVESTTIGAMVVVKTTEQIYIVHRDWIPALDDISAKRAREIFARGSCDHVELAVIFDVGPDTMLACLNATKNFSHLGRKITRGERSIVA